MVLSIRKFGQKKMKSKKESMLKSKKKNINIKLMKYQRDRDNLIPIL